VPRSSARGGGRSEGTRTRVALGFAPRLNGAVKEGRLRQRESREQHAGWACGALGRGSNNTARRARPHAIEVCFIGWPCGAEEPGMAEGNPRRSWKDRPVDAVAFLDGVYEGPPLDGDVDRGLAPPRRQRGARGHSHGRCRSVHRHRPRSVQDCSGRPTRGEAGPKRVGMALPDSTGPQGINEGPRGTAEVGERAFHNSY